MLLVSLDGFAVSGSDLILLCTTSTRLVSNNVQQHQNLRRVRVCSLPRLPTMTKPPRALAHSPILCFYCAPCLCDPDEPCLMLFFRSVFWPGSYAYPFGNSPARSRSVSISMFCSLLALKWARRCSRSVQNNRFSWPVAALAASVLQKSSMVCPVRFPCTLA